MFVVCCLLIFVCHSLFIVRCVRFVAVSDYWMQFVVCCLVFIAYCVLLCDMCCLLLAVCCDLCVV